MSVELISEPPVDVHSYVTALENDNCEKYVMELSLLLRQNAFNIKTTPIPISWATDALIKSETKQYRVRMQQVPVNFGELGMAHGIFYFEWQKPN